VISVGLNKNTKFGCLADKCYGLKAWHSELDALYGLDKDKIKGAILYVAGLSKGGNIVCSKPCRHCEQFLKKYPLKAIYYSMPNKKYGRL